ncbi:MAG: DUF4864 domain-containing protein [Alphaproteobacteria bacterium]
MAADDLPTQADQAAIRGVIEGQIEAFRRDDGAAAFGYAAPMIQSMFGDPDNFMRMVRTGYPQVYRPRSFEFRDMRMVGDRLIQSVLVIGPKGVPVLALYEMKQQPDGTWRIAGCTLAALSDKAV